MEKLINVIFIPECIFCRKAGSFFCDKCLAKCVSTKTQIIRLKKQPITLLFVYEYEKLIRDCIRKAKYKNKHFAALKVLAKKVAQQIIEKHPKILGRDDLVLLPIPVNRAKLLDRGFNQAEYISQTFSKVFKLHTCSDILIRTKQTTSQYSNSRKERFLNMQNAFEVKNNRLIKGKTVILADDVCTTGATFIEASKTVLAAGAKRVLCVALARKSLVK